VKGRLPAVALVLVGAGLILLAAGRTWAVADLAAAGLSVAGDGRHVEVSGRSAAPVVPALALVALAGAVVLATAGRVARAVAAVSLAAAGVAAATLAVIVARTPGSAVAGAVAEATGTTGLPPAAATPTFWPGVAALGGAAVLAGGLHGLVRGRSWQGPSRRYERTPAAPDDWARLDRGEDPTV
jgi:hypothetical protein